MFIDRAVIFFLVYIWVDQLHSVDYDDYLLNVTKLFLLNWRFVFWCHVITYFPWFSLLWYHLCSYSISLAGRMMMIQNPGAFCWLSWWMAMDLFRFAALFVKRNWGKSHWYVFVSLWFAPVLPVHRRGKDGSRLNVSIAFLVFNLNHLLLNHLYMFIFSLLPFKFISSWFFLLTLILTL